MKPKVYAADIGTEIILDCRADLTGAVAPVIAVRRPDGTETTWPATVVEATKLLHVLIAGEIATAGEYKLQPLPNLPGWTGRGTTVTLVVYEKFT